MKKYLFSLITLLLTLTFQSNAQSNQYLHFDGENDYVSVPNASEFLANENAVSMAGWFNADILQYGAGMMGIRGGGTGTGGFYILQLNGGTLECRILTTTGLHQVVGPAGTINAQQWHHLALVYDGSSLELFVDGISIGSSSASGTIQSIDKPFAVGKSIEGGFNFVYPGKADEVSLWTKALTSTDIANMMSNELVGDETDLELYFKFNHGYPNEDNTAFKAVSSTTGNGSRDAIISNMALTGSSSNFGGTLEPDVQAISFPQLANKTSISPPFTISAVSTSGLPVSFQVESGPAQIDAGEITVQGPGTVVIAASQGGNGTYGPAEVIYNSFEVIDAANNTPNIDIRNPLAGDFYATTLQPIELAAIINIDYDQLFDVHGIYFSVDGENISLKDWGNEHYTAWYTPTSYGAHTFEVTAVSNFGGSHTETVSFNITNSVADLNVDAFTDMWLDLENFSEEVDAVLPSYVGAFNKIDAVLDIACPTGGCDPWDRVSSIEVKGHNGEWYQIIRYLTPYGVPCDHEIDLTDFMSLLQGKVTFRGNLGTQGNGFLYSINLDYIAGAPAQSYSKVEQLWKETYDFGNMDNLQPCEVIDFNFEDNVEAATLKLVSSGHGWGPNNTGNAAEFHEDTHHIWVLGAETFSQHNWNTCNPNPDDCSPQSGTWTFDRAGWCPGSIAQWFDYNMTPFISTAPVELKYIFDEDYVDLCHPNNPNCISGTTCDNCNDGFNPHLIVKSHLISFRNSPFNIDTTYQPVVGVFDREPISFDYEVYPNPSSGRFVVNVSDVKQVQSIAIYTADGSKVASLSATKLEEKNVFSLTHLLPGVYLVKVDTKTGERTKKLVIE